MERAKLSREQAELTVSSLRRRWKEMDLGVPDSVSEIPAGGPPLDDPAAGAWDADSSQASATEPEEPVCKQAKVLDREARYVIVELPGAVFRLHKAGASGCWMGRKRAFRNSRDYTARPKAHEYTHVCKLCWPARAGNPSDDDPSEGSLANSGDEHGELNSPSWGFGPFAKCCSTVRPS